MVGATRDRMRRGTRGFMGKTSDNRRENIEAVLSEA